MPLVPQVRNLGPNELTALDVIGYNLAVVPEPGSAILLLGGLIAHRDPAQA
jgi:hypothetical protein